MKIQLFELNAAKGDHVLRLPAPAACLQVLKKDQALAAYFVVEPGADDVAFAYYVHPTGDHDLRDPQTLDYLETVPFHQGAFVLHVFERQLPDEIEDDDPTTAAEEPTPAGAGS